MRLAVAVVVSFVFLVASSTEAVARRSSQTAVDLNDVGHDTAVLSAIGKEESVAPGSGRISVPQQVESVDIALTDPCKDVTSIITTFDYTTCWVATPTLNENTPPTPDDARQRVLSYVRSMKLPSPRPETSAPNGGICGVVHTLNLHIDDVNPAFYDPTTEFGPMVVRFHGKFTVDWGDGTKNVYRNAGGPYPYSVISHSWTDRGFYNIRVTADWTAEWSLGGFSGVVGGFQTTGAIEQWRVWEAQAMLIA